MLNVLDVRYPEMAFICLRTIFQIGRVLPIYFRRKETTGGKEEECAREERFPFLEREDLRYYAQ